MIQNSLAQKVVCFGDSLTWGNFHSGIRFDTADRWTFILQELLGNEYDVIDEGLRSRTTNIDDPNQGDRNGFQHLRACVESHDPINFLVYFLGTNDTKTKFNRSANETIAAIDESIAWIKNYKTQKDTETKIIIVAPPQISTEFLKPTSQFDSNSNEKIIELGKLLKVYAQEQDLSFIDLSLCMKGANNDGVHLTVEDNRVIAGLVCGSILSGL